jgi:hypothetical protein
MEFEVEVKKMIKIKVVPTANSDDGCAPCALKDHDKCIQYNRKVGHYCWEENGHYHFEEVAE